MEVRFWGARGSYPASGASFAEFGHHTPCVAVSAGDDLIVLDAGSGAAALGQHLLQKPVARLHLLLSHFHHDHVTGLPFLFYGAGEGTAVSIHAALGADLALREIVAGLFSAPYFPGDATDWLGRVTFHAHAEGGAFDLGDFAVATTPLAHPGGSTAFRLVHGGRSLVYASDVENNVTPDAALVALASGVDLLIHDTMFTAEEAATHRGWGHATFDAAVALGRQAGVRRIAGFHHSPRHDDATLRRREQELAALSPGAFLAREGQTLRL
jgi:phosphoribosyl 1,2-cyclic phosphodiesterase